MNEDNKYKHLSRLPLKFSIACITALTAYSANANDVGKSISVIEEILVTARKREENLQEVPISVTALSGTDLRNKSIASPVDLKYATPGLEVRSAGLQRNNLQFFLRGQGQSFGTSPGVVTYFSDAPVGNSPKVGIGNNGQFFDLESVQVFKGPQGTLFGRNTTGGAVVFTPKHPDDEFGGNFQTKLGDYGLQEYSGAVTVPLIDGVLSARLAGNVIRRDGFTDSLTTGQELDNRDRESFRLGVNFTPADWLDSYFMYQHNEVNENNTGAVLYDFNENNPVYNTTPLSFVPGAPPPGAGWLGIALPPGLFPQSPNGGICYAINPGNPAAAANCINTRLGILNTLRTSLIAEENRINTGGDSAKRKNLTGEDLIYKGKNEQFNNITTIKFGDLGVIGGITAKNIFNSVRNLGVHTKYDSGSPLGNGLIYNNFDYINFQPTPSSKSDGNNDWFDDFSEEFQLLGTINDKHEWIVGYYYEEDYDELNYPPLFTAYGNVFSVNPLRPDVLQPAVVGTFTSKSLNKDSGYFAQGSIDMGAVGIDGLKVTYGWRRSKSEFEAFGRQFDQLAYWGGNLQVSTVSAPRPPVDDEAITRNFSIDYQLNDDILLYFANRTGFKPGGSNVSPPQGAVVSGFKSSYDAEEVEDVELGIKADWEVAGRPLRTNIAVYRTWYDNIQRTEVLSLNGTPFTQTANIAEAEIDGLELTALFQATDRLGISVNYSYIDAGYTNWPGFTTAVLTGELKPLVDSPYVGAPEHQGTLTLSYLLPTPSEWGEITAKADYYHQSSVHLNDTELADGFGKEDGYGNLNMRLDWQELYGSPVDVGLFVTNATDELHALSLNSFYSVVGTANAIYSEPRMWGIELRYRFGSEK